MQAAPIYTRVSTDKQTIENQLPELRQLAAERGFEPLVYEEVESAVKKRPVLDRLLADVRAGRVQAICVWSLDRLGRGFACFDLFRELTRLGVPVLSVREPWKDVEGPARDLLVAVMSWVSGFERQRLIERTRAGLERARREGKPRASSRIPRPPSRGEGVSPQRDRRRGGCAGEGTGSFNFAAVSSTCRRLLSCSSSSPVGAGRSMPWGTFGRPRRARPTFASRTPSVITHITS